jgi:hypothetical protein
VPTARCGLDNLPEGLKDGSIAEHLREVCELDLSPLGATEAAACNRANGTSLTRQPAQQRRQVDIDRLEHTAGLLNAPHRYR